MSSTTKARAEDLTKIEDLTRRVREDADDVDALNDLGVALARYKRFDEAVRHFTHALEIQPGRKMLWSNAAAAYNDMERPEDAMKCFERLRELGDASVKVLKQLAQTQRMLKRYPDALKSFQEAISLEPESPEVHFDLAMTFADLERIEAARNSYEKALSLKPDYVNAHNNLGILLKDQGKFEEALEHLREVVRLRPHSAIDQNNLGVGFADAGQHEVAIACYRKALSIDENCVLALNNIGNALRTTGHPHEAIASLMHAIRLKPDYVEAFNNIAIAYLHTGDPHRAIEHYNQAILLRPNYPEARMNRALVWLGLGNFESGWPEYEWRWQLRTAKGRMLPGKRWDGSPLNGKRLLVRCEQGVGDTFHFVRYLPMLKQRGAWVIFEGQENVRHLLTKFPGIDEYVPRGQALPAYDYYTTLLSLPGLFETHLDTIPAVIPYLFAEASLVERWAQHLTDLDGMTVGIAWQGNPEHRGDRQRSIPLEQFRGLSQVEGVRLVSLQRGFGVEQITKLTPPLMLETFEGIEDDIDAFMRTAAIIKNLDLVITVDTAVAHLAGAMGVRVWVALPGSPDWRWLRDREDSPWYPSMRLFRRASDGSWEQVFGRIVEALREKVAEWKLANTATLNAAEPEKARELLRQVNKAIDANELALAEQLAEQAIRADPVNADVHHDLGVALAKQGKRAHAIACFRRVLELKPNSASAYANLGLAFLHSDRIEESIAHLRKAIHFGGGTAEVYNNLGIALMRISDADAAVESYMRALYLKPDYAAGHYNLSRAFLLQGRFEQGWLEYEWRKECGMGGSQGLPGTSWTGAPLAGRRLLLSGEQGLGDVIQFARFASVIKRQESGKIVVECQPELTELLKRCEGVDEVIPAGSKRPQVDLHASLLSVPAILRTTLATIPAAVPYLSADPVMSSDWASRLCSLGGMKIGIAWQGNPQHGGDRQRSIPLKQFERLSQEKGVRLVSLQRGYGVEQIDNLSAPFELETFAGVDEGVDGFMRTAAIITNLDLVITVDTAVGHLAGALGIPVWVALPAAPDWRWFREREDSPWYPSMRLFRQQHRDQWSDVFDRIAEALSHMKAPKLRAANMKLTQEQRGNMHTDAPQISHTSKNLGRSVVPVKRLLQDQFDVAVVIPTIVRPSLVRAVRSVFEQRFEGRIQILLGVDKWVGNTSIVDELEQLCPANCVLSILDLGYSTSTRNGGLYPAMPGGGLRTILSYAANSTRIAYLDDDNWFGESHLQTLVEALHGNSWAHSLRWYVDFQTSEPLAVDQWESVGKGRGVYAEKLGGFVDPNCLMIDKIECEPVLKWWCFPVPEDRRGISEDRQVFKHLKEYKRVGKTELPTAYYMIHPDDDLHPHRIEWIQKSRMT